MVSVTQEHSNGKNVIVVHNNDTNDGPVVYTPEEAENLREELDRVLG